MKQLHTLAILLAITFTTSIQAQDLKIYVSDAENFAPNTGKILQYDIDGSNPITFIDEELSWPQDIVFLADQNVVLISNLNSNKITKHNAVTGAYIEDFAVVAGGPTRMKIGSDNLLYVLQWSATDNKVLRFQQDGTFVDEYTNTGVPRSIGFDWDSNGNLYVSSFSLATITSFDTSGNLSGEFIDNTELSGPTNIYFDASDNLFVFDWSDGDIEQFTSAGIYTGRFIDDLGQVEGVDFLSNGNLLIGKGATAEIKQYTPNGMFVENTVEAGDGNLEQPNAVTIFDRSTLSIQENGLASQIFITPSIGVAFTLHGKSIANFDSVTVYNNLGIAVKELSLENTSWDASRLAEGIYYVVGTSSGKKSTQKIIVKK
jgi:hypothetical protein